MTLGKPKNYRLLILLLLILVANVFLFRLYLKDLNERNLTFAMLDVGQGDALFIESPTGTQILFDAGPTRSVLGRLSQVMSPFDKSIDAIVITNPDADHMGGFLDILKTYKVGQVFESGTFKDSKTYQNLKAEISRQNIPEILAKKGMKLDLGGGVVIDILFPDRDVFDWTPNDGSIVARLSHGETSVMLMGDSTIKTEKIILENNMSELLKSDILKIGHHGSRTSSSADFLQAVAPTHALISNGRDNKYGHPHQETLDTLTQFGAQVFRTDIFGTIIMQSDGKNASFSFKK